MPSLNRIGASRLARILRATRPPWSPHAEETGAWGQRKAQWCADVIAIRGQMIPPEDRDLFNELTGLHEAQND